jgi:protein-disulfide isomerase
MEVDMNHRRLVVGAALLLPVSALLEGAQQRPPILPGDQVATVGNLSVSRAELERLADAKLLRVRADEFIIRQRVLEERIAELLLQLEAQRSGSSRDELLRVEIEGKARPVTLEETKAVFESARDRFAGPEDAALESIKETMFRQRVAQRRLEYMKELRVRYGVQVFLDAPRVTIEAVGGPSKGPNDAPVTIVEFSDFQCPYCASMSATLEAILRKYGSQVRLVYRHFPLAIHKDAPRAGEAAACADEQGKFWAMHEIIFANARTLSPANLVKYARDAGLDLPRFEECLSSGRGAEKVRRDRAEGDKYGVSNTPTYFVNGRFLLGALPLEAFAAVLDEELARTK